MTENPFEQKFKNIDGATHFFKNAAIYVHDTLDVAKAISKSIFGNFEPVNVFNVYDRLLQKENMWELEKRSQEFIQQHRPGLKYSAEDMQDAVKLMKEQREET